MEVETVVAIESDESDVIISDEEEEIVNLVTDGTTESDSEIAVDSSLSK